MQSSFSFFLSSCPVCFHFLLWMNPQFKRTKSNHFLSPLPVCRIYKLPFPSPLYYVLGKKACSSLYLLFISTFSPCHPCQVLNPSQTRRTLQLRPLQFLQTHNRPRRHHRSDPFLPKRRQTRPITA